MLIHDDFYDHWPELEPVDLILTDPPYGTLKTQVWDQALDWEELGSIFAQLLKPTGQVVIFSSFWSMIQVLEAFGKSLQYRGYHIWRKSCAMPINKHTPLPDSEFILVFRRKDSKVSELAFNPLVDPGEPYLKRNLNQRQQTRTELKKPVDTSDGGRWIRTVIDAPSKPNMPAAERTSHPTQKPLSLLRKLIRCYSNPGDMILDPFAGSGSTLIAAHQEGRGAIGYEINQEYYEEAQTRIEAETLQLELMLDVERVKNVNSTINNKLEVTS